MSRYAPALMSNEDDADIFTFANVLVVLRKKFLRVESIIFYRNTIFVVSCLTIVNAFYYGMWA